MFNPIENIFGFLKARMRHLLYSDEFKPRIATASTAPWGQKVQLRGAVVTDLINVGVASITREEVTNSYNHMLKLIPQAMDMNDM
jgi:hypothetical protein